MRPSKLLLSSALIALFAAGAGISSNAIAEDIQPEKVNSELTAELFYELLLGEINAQYGTPSEAFSLMLDVARKTGSVKAYERSVVIALRSGNGNLALQTAQAWFKAIPNSKEASLYVLQLSIALNRINELPASIQRHLGTFSLNDRVPVINNLPRYFAQFGDKALAAGIVERALSPDMSNQATSAAAWSTVGRLRLAAGNQQGALDAAQKGAQANPEALEPIVLSMSLMEVHVQGAEDLVKRYMEQTKPSAEVHMFYVRSLLNAKKMDAAFEQVVLLNRNHPDRADAWLVRGSIEYEAGKFPEAKTSLQTYLRLASAGSTTKSADENPDEESDPQADAEETPAGIVQAYLLLSEIAEKSAQHDAARGYLDNIHSSKDILRVQAHRAEILVREGKLQEAIKLIQSVPENGDEDARGKIATEVQFLRDSNKNQQAYDVLGKALERFVDDPDFLYERSMLADKLGRYDEMESMLRKLISKKPDYASAYNALGYLFADRNVRLEEAHQLIQKALDLSSNDPFIVDSMGWVEYRMGRLESAAKLLEQAFSAQPDAEIAAHWGEVLWMQDQHDKARFIWNEGKKLKANNETLIETIHRLDISQ